MMPFGTLRLVCTDKDRHPSRELAIMSHRGDDEELLEVLLAEFPDDEARTIYERDALTSGDVSRKRDKKDPRASGGRRRADIQDRHGEHSGPRWRFRCPSCPLDIPMRHERALKIIENALSAGLNRLDLSRLQ